MLSPWNIVLSKCEFSFLFFLIKESGLLLWAKECCLITVDLPLRHCHILFCSQFSITSAELRLISGDAKSSRKASNFAV